LIQNVVDADEVVQVAVYAPTIASVVYGCPQQPQSSV
jgi:hypothetical protein